MFSYDDEYWTGREGLGYEDPEFYDDEDEYDDFEDDDDYDEFGYDPFEDEEGQW